MIILSWRFYFRLIFLLLLDASLSLHGGSPGHFYWASHPQSRIRSPVTWQYFRASSTWEYWVYWWASHWASTFLIKRLYMCLLTSPASVDGWKHFQFSFPSWAAHHSTFLHLVLSTLSPLCPAGTKLNITACFLTWSTTGPCDLPTRGLPFCSVSGTQLCLFLSLSLAMLLLILGFYFLPMKAVG